MKRLLIVYHSQTGNTARMAEAVLAGARGMADETETVMKRAFDAGIEDLLACHGIIVGTPENFGYMSGAVKDFFDRTYYPAEGKTVALPYAVFVSAGNDGRGAVREIGRIATGYQWKAVAEPVISRKQVTAADLARCEELGATLAAGIGFGLY